MVLILFDVDGTLVDSAAIILEAQRRTFAQHGLEHPGRERGLSIVGLSLVQAFEALVGPEGPANAMAESYRTVFADLRATGRIGEPLFPGAGDLLARLARRDDVLLGLATGKSNRGVDHLIEVHGWRAWLSTVQTADTAASKPSPEMILNACRDTGVAPDRTIMVGDSSFDMQMAQAAGAVGIGVSWGHYGVQELRRSGARDIVQSFPALGRALDTYMDLNDA
jgi:phosphoglycolate phosphatase